MNFKFFEYAATYLKRTMDLMPIVKSVATLNSLINEQTRINEYSKVSIKHLVLLNILVRIFPISLY